MAHVALRRLIGAALVDRELSDGLMNGKRPALMTEFELTAEERRVLGSIESESVRELASMIHAWLVSEGPSASARAGRSAV